MALFLFIAYFVMVLPWLIGGGVMLVALSLAVRHHNAGRSAAVKGWLALAAGPVVAYFAIGAAFDADEARRASYVASLERHRLDGNYPQRLVIHGYMMKAELAVLLHLYDFDEIEMYQDRISDRKMQGSWITHNGGSDCAVAARSWLAERSYAVESELEKNCVSSVAISRQPGERPGEVVLYLMGHATTHKASNELWSSGNYEVRLISGGQNRLVDYWEDYFSSRNSSVLCMAPIGLCANRQGTHVKGQDRLKFLVRALGVEVPDTSARAGG